MKLEQAAKEERSAQLCALPKSSEKWCRLAAFTGVYVNISDCTLSLSPRLDYNERLVSLDSEWHSWSLMSHGLRKGTKRSGHSKKKKVYKSRNNYNLVCHRLLRVGVSMVAPIQLAWPSSEILFFLNSPKCSDTLSDKSGSFAAVRVLVYCSAAFEWYSTAHQRSQWFVGSQVRRKFQHPSRSWHRAWRCTLLILTA